MDREMLRLFYQRYSREIYLYLYSLCKNREAAEDMMQEVFLKALLSWNDENGNLRAWLYKVARNICMNHLKKAGRETGMGEKEIRDTDLSPDEKYIMDEEKRTLYQGMLTLPVRQREILELFYFSEMSMKEIAVFLRLSPENVRVLAFRAKKALKSYMEVKGYEL
ncbi:RNA polymerase sigma factor [Ruminococcus sp. 5_1_39BFAA]|uniref:RNA polymerase sigma factor n=1 Tax=Ruminococcus sp. 5_1_39BFAA TaxID=457412 RepID=UPI0035632645